MTPPDERPFDAVDFGLMLATAMVPPHWPFAIILGVTTIARRNSTTAAYIRDALGLDPAHTPRWLLPGAAPDTTPAAPARHTSASDGATLDSLGMPATTPAATESLSAALARLPKRVDLLTLRLAPSPTALPLGIDPDGSPVWIDLASDTYHIGLYGQTGAGKDNLLRCWFVLLARRNAPSAVQFAFLDGKGDWLIPQLARLGHMFIAPAGGYGKKGDAAILAAVQTIDAEAERRAMLNQAAGVTSREAYLAKTGKSYPLLVVVASDVMTSVAGAVEELLVNLVSKARSLGIRIVVSFQTPTGRDTRWRSNLSTVLAGALQAGSQDEPALSIPVKDLRYRPSALPPPQQQPGVFVCRAAGAQHLVRAPYLSGDAFSRQVATLPAPPQTSADDLLTALLSAPISPADDGTAVTRDTPPHNGVDRGVTASGCDVTPAVDVVATPISPAEAAQIASLLATLPPSEVTKRIGGNGRNYKATRAKVDAVTAMLASGATKPKANDLDAPGGPALPDAFNF